MKSLHRGWRSRVRKLSPKLLVDTWGVLTDPEVLVLDWVHRGPVKTNWGDAIAPHIAYHLSGRKVVNHRDVFNLVGRTVYTTIGSMLGSMKTPGFEVWGSGFVDSGASLQVRPGRIHAVRGPLTAEKLRTAGVSCPDVYGDPALVVPDFIVPKASAERFELGIIPHFKEKQLPNVRRLAAEGAHIIDIQAGLQEVVDEINKCDHIASSSLHGLVAADAYQVPAIWVTFSNRPYGDGFKFKDYLASTESRSEPPLAIGDKTSPAEVLARFGDQPDPCIIANLRDALLQSSPF